MKQFEFSLQSWYDMQQGLEKQHKLQIGTIEAAIAKLKDELAALNADYDKAKDAFSSAVTMGMSAPRVRNYGFFFDSLKAAMAAVQEQIAKLEREKEQWLQKLVHVRRELKLLDKLHDAQYRDYLCEAKREHDKFVDDLVSYKVTVS